MKTLGSTLKKNRESRSMTLRQVEEATGISNAYLSQLENDKIKTPSANTLFKLANLYVLDFNTLLEQSGIIKKSNVEKSKVDKEIANRVAFYSDKMTEEIRNDILNYIDFIVNRKNVKPPIKK